MRSRLALRLRRSEAWGRGLGAGLKAGLYPAGVARGDWREMGTGDGTIHCMVNSTGGGSSTIEYRGTTGRAGGGQE
jgi:hypothetical protein